MLCSFTREGYDWSDWTSRASVQRRDPLLDSAPWCKDENAPDPSDRGRSDFLECETGFGPATLTLAKRRKPKKWAYPISVDT